MSKDNIKNKFFIHTCPQRENVLTNHIGLILFPIYPLKYINLYGRKPIKLLLKIQNMKNIFLAQGWGFTSNPWETAGKEDLLTEKTLCTSTS